MVNNLQKHPSQNVEKIVEMETCKDVKCSFWESHRNVIVRGTDPKAGLILIWWNLDKC